MKRLLFVVLMMTHSVSWAEWERTGVTDRFSEYHDKSSLRRDGVIVKMWTMKEYFKGQIHDAGYMVKSVKILQIFNCKNETYALVSISEYSDSMGTGVVLSTVTRKESQWVWEPIIPSSVGEGTWKIACGVR